MTGSEALVEALRMESVKTIFGIVGSAFMDPLDIFARADIRFIQVRHEQNAALMAEGYSRATGAPGVCIGQNGPGVTNLVTGVASALLNHTPMVVITPSVTTGAAGTCSFQEIDQMRLMEPIVVWQRQVNQAERMADAVRGAFRAAIALRGPAQIDIPRDLYYGVFEGEVLPRERYRVDDLNSRATESSINDAIKILKNAKRPMILAGLGAVSTRAHKAIGELADTLCAPVACVWQHNDAFPANHPWFAGVIGYQSSEAAMRLLSESDCVIALGTRLNTFGTNPQYGFDFYPGDAKLIQNSINPLEIGALRPVDVGLVGECGEVAEQLSAAVAKASVGADRKLCMSRLQEEKKKWESKLEDMSDVDAEVIHPRRALNEIRKALPADTSIVVDVGNVSGTGNGYFTFDKPGRWFGHGSLGGIGVGFSTGLGVKMAKPDEPVLCLVGDGAWSMTLQEVMTAVDENINLVTVIFDNSQYGAEKRNQYDFYDNRFFWTDLKNPDFVAIAEQMGALGIRVTRAQDIAPALSKAFSERKPVVIGITVDSAVLSEPYRRDALKPPVRIMQRYRND